jgi:phage terminase large subunit
MSELIIDTTISYKHIDSCPTRICHLIGGTRSGKSYGAMQWCIVQALQNVETITIVRKTIPSLKRTIMKDFKDIMENLGIWHESEFNITDRIYRFSNGSEIQFVSCDSPEKLRGLKSTILWIEEASEVDEESWFQLSIRTSGKIILSYNPTISPFHFLRQMQDCSRYFTTYRDNTFLDPSIRKAIEDLKHTNLKAWKIYGLGEYTSNDRAVFQFNVCEWIDEEAELVGIGVDFGFSQDQTAIVSVFRNGDNVYLVENCYEKGMLTKEIAGKLKEIVGDKRTEIIADSAEPRLIEELYREGLNIKPVKKGPDSISFGIQLMQGYKLNIPKTCQNLVNEFYSYQYAVDKHQHTTDKPEGGLDHLIDAARYVFMMKLSNKATSAGKYVIRVR